MPVPPPLPQPLTRSRRRLRRWRAHAAEREYQRGLVVALNFLVGVRPRAACDTSREREPTEEQRRHLGRLGQAARRFARLGRVPGCELGRFWPNAANLDGELKDLEADLHTFAATLDEYGVKGEGAEGTKPRHDSPGAAASGPISHDDDHHHHDDDRHDHQPPGDHQ